MDTTSATPMTIVETATRQLDHHGAQEQPIRTTRGAPTTMKSITTTGLIRTLNTTVNPCPDNLGGTVYLELEITLININVKASTLSPQLHSTRGNHNLSLDTALALTTRPYDLPQTLTSHQSKALQPSQPSGQPPHSGLSLQPPRPKPLQSTQQPWIPVQQPPAFQALSGVPTTLQLLIHNRQSLPKPPTTKS